MISLDPTMKLSDKGLAPCPFCNVRLNYVDPNGGEPAAQHPHSDECVLSQFFLWGAEPIAAWNRRASPAPSSDLVERLEKCAAKLEGLETLPKPYDLYYAVKNDGPGWSYHCAHIGVSEVREAATSLAVKDARTAEQDGELARLSARLEEAEGALEKAQELAKVAEELTGCRGDDDFVRSVQEVIARALASIRGGA